MRKLVQVDQVDFYHFSSIDFKQTESLSTMITGIFLASFTFINVSQAAQFQMNCRIGFKIVVTSLK